MKRAILTIIISILIYSCVNNDKEINIKEEVEIENFGLVVKELSTENTFLNDFECCQEYNLFLVNNSFNKKIQFTLQREWYYHIHCKRDIYNCTSCGHLTCNGTLNNLNMDTIRIDLLDPFGNPKSLVKNGFGAWTHPITITLEPGQRRKIESLLSTSEWFDGVRETQYYLVKNYIIVGELEIIKTDQVN